MSLNTDNDRSTVVVVPDDKVSDTTTLLHGNKAKHRKHEIGGLKLSPELVAIAMVYFVQGILGLSRLALSFYYKDELNLGPSQMAVLTGIAGAPWVVKPLYGFISDSIPLFGYRRRSYLVACGFLGTIGWSALAFGHIDTATGAVACMMLASLSTAFSDVVVDSIVVERARGEPQETAGSYQSLCWAAQSSGGIISAYFSGSLVQDWGVYNVFALTALFPLIVSCSASLIDEKPSSLEPAKALPGRQAPEALQQQLVQQAKALWGAIKQPEILYPTIFIFLWQATPSAETAMFYFQTTQLHFSPEFLGRIRLASTIASLVGVGLFNWRLKKVPLRPMLKWSMLAGTGLGLTQLMLVTGVNRSLGISDQVFALADTAVLTVLGQVAFLPILVMAARICPEGVEATLYATLMSVSNAGYFSSTTFGAGLTAIMGVTSTNFNNLALLVALCTGLQLLPYPFLRFVPDEKPEAKEEGETALEEGTGSGSGKSE